jgi:hypothetical protein
MVLTFILYIIYSNPNLNMKISVNVVVYGSGLS